MTLVSGDTDLFTLQGSPDSTEGLLRLVATETFDREARPDYWVTIEADDGSGIITHAIIQIDIEDSNEHVPKFDLPYYLSELPSEIESFEDGASKLLNVFASDADGDDITYSLEDTMDDLFNIDPLTGDIGLNMESVFSDMENILDNFKDLMFDRSYELTVHADDGRGFKGSTLVQVQIYIIQVLFAHINGHLRRPYLRRTVHYSVVMYLNNTHSKISSIRYIIYQIDLHSNVFWS